MSYNRENYKAVKHAFELKERLARDRAEERKKELYEQFPDIKAIDRELSLTSITIMREIAAGPDRITERIDALRRTNLELQQKRSEAMLLHGYPTDFTDPAFECEECRDTGYLPDGEMCHCFRRALVMAGYESSGIGRLLATQSFESFKLEYYADDERSYANMQRIFTLCTAYAGDFDGAHASNLLLCGNTGLGKTHLSTSIAKIVIEHGYDVVYDTAQNVFRDFERERFERSYVQEAERPSTDRYFDCDLLIIDDLGTEMSNQFTVSCLYNIINSRLIAGKSMIINTNLGRDELYRRYSDRITSRLFGEFSPLLFSGVDIRQKKLTM